MTWFLKKSEQECTEDAVGELLNETNPNIPILVDVWKKI
jgi:hypothetical protein